MNYLHAVSEVVYSNEKCHHLSMYVSRKDLNYLFDPLLVFGYPGCKKKKNKLENECNVGFP